MQFLFLVRMLIKRRWRPLRGQVSAEMLVLTAAIIAIAFLLITQLESTAVKSASVMSNKTDQILESLNSLS